MACKIKNICLKIYFMLCFISPVISCIAKPGGSGRRSPRTAFYLHQKVPDIDEFTQGASGKPTEPIRYNSDAYKQLSSNYNPGIIFEHTNERLGNTRKMSKRCLKALDSLERKVKEKWSKIRLRVIAAWDDEKAKLHDVSSLHYEGRAVDITTSDRDRSKLGLLARLAVEAGFDWVHYVEKYRVHASVRVDSKGESQFKEMGCFRSNSTVRLKNGRRLSMNELKVGDMVQAMDRHGKITYSEVVMFLDNQPKKRSVLYFVIETSNPKSKLYLTKSHLIYVKRRYSSFWSVDLAKMTQRGDKVKVWKDGKLVEAEVSNVSISEERGVIAPLTEEGNIIVDGVLASCYAFLNDHEFANAIFWPAKFIYRYFPSLLNNEKSQEGVHWYAKLLLYINQYISVIT